MKTRYIRPVDKITNKVQCTSDIKNQWHEVNFMLLALANESKMIRWLMTQIQGKWSRKNEYAWVFYFELEEDCVLFKMTWLNAEEIENDDFIWLYK